MNKAGKLSGRQTKKGRKRKAIAILGKMGTLSPYVLSSPGSAGCIQRPSDLCFCWSLPSFSQRPCWCPKIAAIASWHIEWWLGQFLQSRHPSWTPHMYIQLPGWCPPSPKIHHLRGMSFNIETGAKDSFRGSRQKGSGVGSENMENYFEYWPKRDRERATPLLILLGV